eukprot:gnl/MRDRNA2_/MRDRNA2_243093_c0_seq1.p1 gnl/MRDRNA2_/MRDRNA2_243093_c0~~gnl/MRDRNA2_/MRDRNA2_243093_c0_seq1.p1  ORF type:complete len:128 (+),score=5.32 gnl/MRDRNA2_/MRDRNA2_243093_c0_seq1:46-384(+)
MTPSCEVSTSLNIAVALTFAKVLKNFSVSSLVMLPSSSVSILLKTFVICSRVLGARGALFALRNPFMFGSCFSISRQQHEVTPILKVTQARMGISGHQEVHRQPSDNLAYNW